MTPIHKLRICLAKFIILQLNSKHCNIYQIWLMVSALHRIIPICSALLKTMIYQYFFIPETIFFFTGVGKDHMSMHIMV